MLDKKERWSIRKCRRQKHRGRKVSKKDRRWWSSGKSRFTGKWVLCCLPEAKVIQFFNTERGLAVTFTGNICPVIAFITGYDTGDFCSVLPAISVPGSRQHQTGPTATAIDISHQKGLSPGGQRHIPLLDFPGVCNLLCPQKQFHEWNYRLYHSNPVGPPVNAWSLQYPQCQQGIK